MKKVYVVNAKRTAIGSFLGSLKDVSAASLGAAVVKDLLQEANVQPEAVQEVIVGNILSAGVGQGIARQVAVQAGIPVETCAYSVNMLCGSGMKAVMMGVNELQAGLFDLVVAGGTENMSAAPYLLPKDVRGGIKMGEFKVVDHMLNDALTDAFTGIHMGVTAENIAKKYSITREAQDTFAIASQTKAIAAVDAGKFKDEIVPISIASRKETIIFDTDEYPNRKTSLEKLGGLRPAFVKDGSVTAGNASGINDGASFVLLATEEALKKYNLTPMAEVVAIGQGGVEPTVMGLGPTPAIRHALGQANMKLDEMELVELNEAFAAQSLGVIHELVEEHHIDREAFLAKTNVNGGAIALGHPVGASGNRILVTLLHEMKRQNLTYGLASLCIGGGMGTAVIVKNVK